LGLVNNSDRCLCDAIDLLKLAGAPATAFAADIDCAGAYSLSPTEQPARPNALGGGL